MDSLPKDKAWHSKDFWIRLRAEKLKGCAPTVSKRKTGAAAHHETTTLLAVSTRDNNHPHGQRPLHNIFL